MQGVVGFGFASHWHKIFKAITEHSNNRNHVNTFRNPFENCSFAKVYGANFCLVFL